MKYEVYKDLYIRDMYAIFEFFSIGPKGLIPKRIAFIPTEYPDIYNLVFGDINMNDEIDDYSVSDNGDRNKVLATVAYAVEIYLNKHPNRYVFFTGSTKERTRLYRMAIGLNFDELSSKFNIYCQTDTGIIPFQKNIPITGLLIKRKL
ncbi:hypothetical protein ECE50_020975 [Chitinophaga sp. Mgbs1]|uniref:Uncharacterized protein n=1 Tax=Chitinophaga solisilvae TaxID=1233460 RepID=A0A9Q5D9B4_9BACT|nr:hypothetical protein [Chitinophaga solisilvae]